MEIIRIDDVDLNYLANYLDYKKDTSRNADNFLQNFFCRRKNVVLNQNTRNLEINF